MYLPESKYSEPKYTRGDEYTLSNGSEYVGWYFIAYTGEVFTGKQPLSTSERLFLIEPVTDSFRESLKFVSENILPTEQDYTQGKFVRYFLQDKRNKGIIEVSKDRFLDSYNLNYILSAKVEWILKGPAEDTKFGPYIHFGAASQNKENILKAEKTIVGLSSYIKSYSKFVK
jgi:hypothetical protein